jgi:hypothetical protein
MSPSSAIPNNQAAAVRGLLRLKHLQFLILFSPVRMDSSRDGLIELIK